jgi:hypothetical protein
VWSEVGRVRLNVKDEKSRRDSQGQARTENGPIRGGDQKNGDGFGNRQD